MTVTSNKWVSSDEIEGSKWIEGALTVDENIGMNWVRNWMRVDENSVR